MNGTLPCPTCGLLDGFHDDGAGGAAGAAHAAAAAAIPAHLVRRSNTELRRQRRAERQANRPVGRWCQRCNGGKEVYVGDPGSDQLQAVPCPDCVDGVQPSDEEDANA
jgi:hypothetical protein